VEQLEALQLAVERQFCDRAVTYLGRQYPQVCAALDERSIRASVETALQKRATYRFDSEETFFAYLDLMYLLGFDFDRDPEKEWVRGTFDRFRSRPTNAAAPPRRGSQGTRAPR